MFPFLSRNFPYGKIQQWNLNLQRQMGHSLVMEAMYQGSHGTDLIVFDNADFRAPGPGNVQTLLALPAVRAHSGVQQLGDIELPGRLSQSGAEA